MIKQFIVLSLTCDHAEHSPMGNSPHDFRAEQSYKAFQEVRKAGWQIGGEVAICPTCVEREKNPSQ
jgi:hypothetical protein